MDLKAKWWIFYLLGLASAVIVSCGKGHQTPVQWGIEHQVLLIANGDEPQTLDPKFAIGSNDLNIVRALFESLVELDGTSLEPIPGCAERWEVSEDGLQYRFVLRDNLTWSDGTPIKAEDFIYAWRRALNPSSPSPNVALFYPIAGAENYASNGGGGEGTSQLGVTSEGREITIRLRQRTPYFLETLAHPVFAPVPRHLVDQCENAAAQQCQPWTRPGTMVGNGPFKLNAWELNQRVALEKNAHYWDREHVLLEGIEFIPIENQLAEERAFRTGQVHLTYTSQMAIEKIAEYRKKRPDVLYQSQNYASYYYIFNTRIPPFDQVKVRRALALAIDRELLVSKVTKGGEIPARDLLPPDKTYFPVPSDTLFDPQQARKLLAEAGYPDGADFPQIELLYNNGELHRKVAIAIQQMWKMQLNIRTKLVNQEWKTFIDAQNNKMFSISRAGWIADYQHPTSFLATLTTESAYNDSYWGIKEYDALIESGIVAVSSADAQEIFRQAAKILRKEMPVIPLFHSTDNNLVHESVQNWTPNPMHRHPYKYVYLQDKHH
ncbi:peptide ABC transporter substrate-binding protein [Teredinibacter turnerae]|uniref:peptide ABC transporter substrate-binding protein n=1 Tax=Teredinibacter turnerae TaxID=2426 RepID=UPI00035FCF21|nr:peptide ABC transporter substrate-binding protein [Teredinibacter turnerae]